MSQTKLLLDTNTYLRLAQSIHPLLGKPFGNDKFTLYIHKEVEIELNRSSRLQTKFYWVEEEEYKANRKKKLIISKLTQDDIEKTYDYIYEYQKDQRLHLSREDIYCISTALELKITLVTDDQNMLKTCIEFGVNKLSTLQLLKLMLANNKVNLSEIRQITDYWKYAKDIPANFIDDVNKLFPEL